MTTLFEAVNSSAKTDNGALTNASSLNSNVDLFFLAGASRNKDITSSFAGALVEDSEVAVRILQWARDVRAGAGERETFRNLFTYLIKTETEIAARILAKLPELGRWDDIHTAFGTTLEKNALDMISFALKNNDGLCAKWQPRQGAIANKIRSYMKLTPKAYRKLLVSLSNTVEQKMCAQEWNKIEYSHVPSIAAARYQQAFARHDPKGYSEYKEKLIKGDAKINASVAYPYDVIRSMKNGDHEIANQQWLALPNYLKNSNENILPVVDVSGSMSSVAVSGSVTALDVAVSLGLYLSERVNGAFKDQFITFSSSPNLLKLSGNLAQRYKQMHTADWGMNTDLHAVFKLILDAAQKNNIDQSQMPTKILILSDMEFDQCVMIDINDNYMWSSKGKPVDVSAMTMIKTEYENFGYQLPQIIFWNLNGRPGNIPVSYHQTGTALVSGFSPSIVQSVLGGDDITPLNVMLKTVMIKRYDF